MQIVMRKDAVCCKPISLFKGALQILMLTPLHLDWGDRNRHGAVRVHVKDQPTLSPNRSLDRLPVILGYFHRFPFIFRLLVGILSALFF